MTDTGSVKSLGVLSAIASLLFFYLLSIAHAETWLCTHTNNKNEAVIAKFKIDGNEVIETGGGISTEAHYTIVLNDKIGLVALSAFTTHDDSIHRNIVLGILLLIEKESGVFKLTGGVIPATDDMKSTNGNCVQN